MPAHAPFQIEPTGASFGATVTGLRIAELDDATFAALHRAWLEHALLIFPGQHLRRDEQLAFARRFGGIERLGGHDIVAISNVKPDGSVRAYAPDEWDDMMKVIVGNMGWHADSTYMPVMAKGAVFAAEVVPPEGGETGFADMRAAWDALDDARRRRIEGLSAHHSLRYSQAKLGHEQREGSAYFGYGMDVAGEPLRPLVKVHPETGRRSLLVGRHAHAIPGLDPAESEALLDELLEFACQAPRIYTHHWQPGDVVVWDNRCLLHRAMPWDLSLPRVMWHSRLAGDAESESAVEMTS
jgi:alpha-ketoglutarate-dependent taurine dioxygenase